MEKIQYIPIKNWAEDDKPREKLIIKGKSSLSDAELLAILISTGTKELSALDLAKNLLANANNNLNELAKFDLAQLQKVKGIGDAKAITIIAALELGNRRREASFLEKKKIISSKDAYDAIYTDLADIQHEQFWFIGLNRANKIIRKIKISEGGLSKTVVDAKKIYKIALELSCASIILCHNHPSGEVKPSEEDIKLTKKIKEAGLLLDIAVLDHIIFSEKAYFSFADEGLI